MQAIQDCSIHRCRLIKSLDHHRRELHSSPQDGLAASIVEHDTITQSNWLAGAIQGSRFLWKRHRPTLASEGGAVADPEGFEPSIRKAGFEEV